MQSIAVGSGVGRSEPELPQPDPIDALSPLALAVRRPMRPYPTNRVKQ
jgi:hypothetical protein